jgi:hypothetical protein
MVRKLAVNGFERTAQKLATTIREPKGPENNHVEFHGFRLRSRRVSEAGWKKANGDK